MTKEQHKRDIMLGLAMSLRGELENGSEWIFTETDTGEPYSEADTGRRVGIIHELIAEFRRRGGRA